MPTEHNHWDADSSQIFYLIHSTKKYITLRLMGVLYLWNLCGQGCYHNSPPSNLKKYRQRTNWTHVPRSTKCINTPHFIPCQIVMYMYMYSALASVMMHVLTTGVCQKSARENSWISGMFLRNQFVTCLPFQFHNPLYYSTLQIFIWDRTVSLCLQRREKYLEQACFSSNEDLCRTRLLYSLTPS